MKAKRPSKTKEAAGPVEDIREASAYGAERIVLGAPFHITGGVVVVLTFFLLPAINSRLDHLGFTIVVCLPGFLFGLFLFAIPAVVNAVFDIADCALRQDQREAAREEREGLADYNTL